MSEENIKIRDDLNLDIPFIVRSFLRWTFVSLCVAIICGILCFIAADQLKKNVYTASAVVTVAVKNNDTSYLNDYNFNNAVTRNVDMWNSSALLTAMRKDNPDVVFSGSLQAASIEGSGLVKLTVTADTARDAFQYLSCATQSYQKIANNFDTHYRTVILTDINEDTITVISSSIWKYGVLGFGLGLLMCFGLVGLWTLITDILHNETQAKNMLDAPMLGALPSVQKKGGKGMLITRGDLPISYMEGVDMLTSRIEQSMRHDGKKILMVTSVYENDGKTSTASNIALTLAKRGRKVLLMDMDLLHPSLHKLFEREPDDKINGFYAIKDRKSLQKYAEKSQADDHLDILWQFQAVRDSDGFIENSKLAKQLQAVRDAYDYIILDTPPMGMVRDTEIIAQMAEACLLMARQDICHAKAVNDLIDLMDDCGAACVGVVLNKYRGLIRPLRSYGYKKGYRYSHYKYKRGGRKHAGN